MIQKMAGTKDAEGKLVLSAVPPELIEAVARIREYGNRKYSDPQNWKSVDPEKFHEAMLRHVLASWEDWRAMDPESGMPHLWHIACNVAFLIALLRAES